jgi:hypothetical protein
VRQRLDTRTQVDPDPKNWNESPLQEVRQLERCSPDVRKSFVFNGPSHEEPLNVEVDIHAYATPENRGTSGKKGCIDAIDRSSRRKARVRREGPNHFLIRVLDESVCLADMRDREVGLPLAEAIDRVHVGIDLVVKIHE